MASIVYDDVSSRVSAGGGSWKTVDVDRYFGGSTIYPKFSSDDSGDTGDYASLTVSFQGTSIAFVGNSPYVRCSQYVYVSIDGGEASQQAYTDSSPQNTIQWYKSRTLSDGSHTISITRIAGVALDYMVVTAGLTTPLSGQTLIVDDGDSAISYSGSWSNPSGRYVTDGSSVGFYAHGNAVHTTSSVGASMTFQFTGTSVSVYSVFDYSRIGHMVVVYTVDDDEHVQPYTVSSSTLEYRDDLGHRGNVLLFSKNGLSAGAHTLKIQMTSNDGNGLALSLDYILYTPSFSTLAEKPGIDPGTSTSATAAPPSSPTTGVAGTASSDNTSSSTSIPDSASTTHTISGSYPSSTSSPSQVSNLPSGSSVSSASAATDSSSNSNSSSDPSSSPPIGAILGAVLGVVAIILFVLLLFICKRRRRRRLSFYTPTQASEPQTMQENSSQSAFSGEHLIVKPFLSTTPATTYQDDVKSPFPPSTQNSSFSHSHTAGGSISESAGSTEATTAITTPPTTTDAKVPLHSPTAPAPRPPMRLVHEEHHADSPSSPPPGRATVKLQGRMQRLQDLVQELNHALSDGRSDGARIAELRGRIKELAREDRDSIELDWRGSATPSGVPPPYQR
ncbi:hypothetical protein DXG01_006852 [Tephrocybe rancida]|nr:hypothetical protein DXG01_006852 [Tephrocybe rancida]